jgi:hypothetical protein
MLQKNEAAKGDTKAFHPEGEGKPLKHPTIFNSNRISALR